MPKAREQVPARNDRPRQLTLPFRILRRVSRDDEQCALRRPQPERVQLRPEELSLARPRRRGDCIGGVRPCPWMRCVHHLAIDVTAIGSLRLPFGEEPDLDAMLDTCALDVADRGSQAFERIGRRLNFTRARAQQVERDALERLREHGALSLEDLALLVDEPSAEDGIERSARHVTAWRSEQ